MIITGTRQCRLKQLEKKQSFLVLTNQKLLWITLNIVKTDRLLNFALIGYVKYT